MVKIGDIIETDDGLTGKVTHILLDEKRKRYVICFKPKEDNGTYFIEGDKNYWIIEKNE